MTLKEAIEYINDELDMMSLDPISAPKLQLRINRVQRERALKLRIPTYYYKGQQAQTAIPAPANALSTGLRKVESEQNQSIKIPILTTVEANQKYPDWEENRIEGYTQYYTRFVISDPRNKDAPWLYPVGFDSDETIRYTYTGKVTDLADMTSVIWDGHLEEYHHYIPNFVIWKILLGKGDNRFNLFKGYCEETEESLFNWVQDEDYNDATR